MPFEIKRARHAAGPLAANAAALNRPAWKQITAGLGVNSQIGEWHVTLGCSASTRADFYFSADGTRPWQ